MKQVALGFRAHSGWTALVAIALEEGSPRVLLRERPHLVKAFTYEFRQPYHTAKKGSSAEAHDFVSSVRTEARGLAWEAINSVQSRFRHQGYEVKRCGLLLASGKPLPDLSHILTSHALIHTADGELFREALLHAGKRCGHTASAVDIPSVIRGYCAKGDAVECPVIFGPSDATEAGAIPASETILQLPLLDRDRRQKKTDMETMPPLASNLLTHLLRSR